MAYVALRMPTKSKTTVKLFVISLFILAGSPAAATPFARDNIHCHLSEQKAGMFRHQPKVDAPHWNGADKPHDDWPANMILD